MTLRRRTLLLAAAGGLLGAVAGRACAAEARRLVVLGGDLVEIAYALGAGDRLVGADDTALWPPETGALPKVGYLRRLSPEGVLSLAPDLVAASPSAGPASALDSLRAAGVPIETGPEGEGFDSVAPKIAFMGRILGRGAAAEALAAEVAARMAAVRAALDGAPARPSVLFLISVGRGAPMASGTGTAADAMIALAGGRNAATGFEGYKPLSQEAALGLAPEVVLMPDHAAEAAGGALRALDAAGLALTPAGRAGRIVTMDGLKLLGFGPRTPEAVAELARALHPDLAERLAGL
jgi:iron complex transport system substrate-binding protein